MPVVHTIGINYRTAPLSLRELLSVPSGAVGDYLQRLKTRCQLREAAILSTCNRTEVYCLSATPEKVAGWLDAAAGGGAADYFYCYRARPAVEHLFRVASGLDSQLIGEPEITGQVKQFAALARDSGASGVVINRLMERALAAAAEVRTSTDVGRHSLSYPALAARAAAGIFPDLRRTAVLFVGAGDMARAGLPIFASRGVRRLAVASRTEQKAEKLAAQHGGESFSIAAVPELLAEFDIVLSATASQVPIIGKGAVERALRRRKHKPMMFADLAVPRDLEKEIQDLPDVFVYHLDQFGKMAEDHQRRRELAAGQAQGVITRHADEFEKWQLAQATVPHVKKLRATADSIRDGEVQKALARLERGDAPPEVLRDAARRLTAKLIHLPTVELRRQSSAKKGDEA